VNAELHPEQRDDDRRIIKHSNDSNPSWYETSFV
jgi:hypothetical protein